MTIFIQDYMRKMFINNEGDMICYVENVKKKLKMTQNSAIIAAPSK